MDSLLLFGSQWVDKNPATHNGWCLGPVDIFVVGFQARVRGRREDREDARCHMSRGVGAFFGEEPLNF